MKSYKFFKSIAQCLVLIGVFMAVAQGTSYAYTTDSLNKYAYINALRISQEEQGKDKNAEWQKLNKLAEEILLLIRKNELATARKLADQIESGLLSLELGRYVERLDQAKVLTDSVVQARYALNSVEPQKNTIERKALQMRLVLDAVSHTQQPLWLSQYPTLSKLIEELHQAIERDQRDLFYQRVNDLESSYQLVRPALFVSHKRGVVEQLDSQLAFLTQHTGERWKDKKQTQNAIRALDNQLQIAFFRKANPSFASFIFLLISITTMICAALSYAAWKKYKGEHQQETIPWKKIKPKKIDQP